MRPRSCLLPSVLLALAMLVPAIGAAGADEAAEPTTEADPAVIEPAPEATPAAPDCGCEARSPAQLLETQRRVTAPEPSLGL